MTKHVEVGIFTVMCWVTFGVEPFILKNDYNNLVGDLSSKLHDDIGTVECENMCENVAQPYNLTSNCTEACVLALEAYVHTACHANKTRPGFVTITITNTITNETQASHFNKSVILPMLRVQPFIRYMEEASKINSAFRFEVSHSGRLGYFITSVNGLRNKWNPVISHGYWWNFKIEPSRINAHLGLSSYYPRSGDHISLTFTYS